MPHEKISLEKINANLKCFDISGNAYPKTSIKLVDIKHAFKN